MNDLQRQFPLTVASAVAMAAVWLVAGGAAAALDDVPPARLARLTCGIGLSDWNTRLPDMDNERRSGNLAKDVTLIKAMGFRHVRFLMTEETVVNKETPTVLDPARLGRFDAALDMLLEGGLGVIVDFNPRDELKQAIVKDDAAVDEFVNLWRLLAKHLATRDPEMVFLEVMNEPVMRDTARWNVIQKKALAAMRQCAPQHTLIATSAEWSEIYMLPPLEVVTDKNVVYNVHFYEPVRFTHQDAPWVAGDWVKGLRNAPYPSSPEAVARVLDALPDDAARQLMIRYGKENWDAAKLEEMIAEGSVWAKQHGVHLTCNEFGVYRKAPAADRNRCIEDTRKALEKHHFGWTMWDYATEFGVATGEPGQRVADKDTLKALGLPPQS
ncbi:MAG: cellulase family glycosylhydrolase [Verrucomicrobiota bacterium]